MMPLAPLDARVLLNMLEDESPQTIAVILSQFDPGKAAQVLRTTRADAVMIGRAAQGQPWLPGEMAHFLATGERKAPPTRFQIRHWLLEHLDELYGFYGEGRGLRVARKHIQWYCQGHPGSEAFWQAVNRVADASAQRRAVEQFFDVAESACAA